MTTNSSSNSNRDDDYLHLDLSGKTVVFTGGTDGMGKSAVEKLAAMGATIMLLGRNKDKTMTVVNEINAKYCNSNDDDDDKSSKGKGSLVHYVPCDLASQSSILQAAKSILDSCPHIDVLVNCAGMNSDERVVTEDDGMELVWAVNHLAPFLLNMLLLDRMKESPGVSRIVNLSSAMEKYGHIHLDDIQLASNNEWSTLSSYAQAKLAMNMCTRKLAQELNNESNGNGRSVTVNALNPGLIKTNLVRDLTGWTRWVGGTYMALCGSPPDVGANRILRVALSKEYEDVSGQFVYEDAIRDPNPEALNEELVDQVWALSKQHVGL